LAVHRPTVEVYEGRASDYATSRPPRHGDRARQLAAIAGRGPAPLVDLGSGPGGYVADLASEDRRVVTVDGARAMLDLAGHRPAVQADLEHLPFGRHGLAGAWARNSYLHVPAADLPLALAGLHHALEVGAPIVLSLLEGDGEGPIPDDDLPGRSFTLWRPRPLGDVLTGAGFTDVSVEQVDNPDGPASRGRGTLWATARRARTLPDFVGPGLRYLVCGLNPSVMSADAGFGFARGTNRFWRVAREAGLVTRDRDPWHAVARDRVGMTDLVKRATPRSSELCSAEYREGADRVRGLVEWLRPGSVIFVGLEGWRVAVDRRARPGWQPAGFGGVPAYVMPSTSGLNARVSAAELITHLRAAQAGPPGAAGPPGGSGASVTGSRG
jgi:TDG/mug DNA glycosylase family protein